MTPLDYIGAAYLIWRLGKEAARMRPKRLEGR